MNTTHPVRPRVRPPGLRQFDVPLTRLLTVGEVSLVEVGLVGHAGLAELQD